MLFIKRLVKIASNQFITHVLNKKNRTIYGLNNVLKINGNISNIKINIFGDNNTIEVNSTSLISNCLFYIKGNNNIVKIEKDVVIYGGELWIEDNMCKIVIGEGTTIQKAHIAAVEDRSSIVLGKDCMISTDVEMRTSDSHSIVDNNTNIRLNQPRNIVLKNHVWIGSRVSILKGVTIGQRSIVGTGSIVLKDVPDNCLVAGIPARVIKKDVNWLRERI